MVSQVSNKSAGRREKVTRQTTRRRRAPNSSQRKQKPDQLQQFQAAIFQELDNDAAAEPLSVPVKQKYIGEGEAMVRMLLAADK